MKAMILAAGKGTRLAPLTDKTPKPLLPVAGRPLLDWQLTALAAAGVSDVVINLYHLGEQIAAYAGDGAAWNLRIHYSRETQLLETGGGLAQALPLLGDKPFWVVNGDIWTDFDFSTLPTTPPEHAQAHFVLTPTPAWRAQGDFECSNGWVTARGTSFCYTGIGVWLPSALSNAPRGAFSLRDIFFRLMAEHRLSCQIHNGRWDDIGTLEHYRSLTG